MSDPVKCDCDMRTRLVGDGCHICNPALALEYLRGTVEDQADHIAELKRELELERMRVVACGVVAQANTPETAVEARKMLPDYWSASCADVAAAVDEQMRLRAELAEAQRDAEFERAISDVLPGVAYMDPPDGGSVSLAEQLRRMAVDADRYRWLRMQEDSEEIGVCKGFYTSDFGDAGYARTYDEIISGTDLDAAIDDAMEDKR